MEIFLLKSIHIFQLNIFLKNSSNLISFSEKCYFKFIMDPELPGSGSDMIFYPGSCSRFRIRHDPNPDPQHCKGRIIQGVVAAIVVMDLCVYFTAI